jgi:hypothetical protein
MADRHHLKKPVNEQIQSFVADASLQIDIGDLMYLDTDDAKPASSQADQLSETLNQALFASKFAGVANSSRSSADGSAGTVRVQVDGLYEFPVVSSTFEIGDLLGADEAASGTALEDQQLRKVTHPDLAVAVVTERKASAATKVWARILSRVGLDLGNRRPEPVPSTVAAAGSAQGDAGALADGLNYVSAADGTKGVVLPTGFPGRKVRVYNLHASNGLKVYPHSGGDINDGTGDAAVTIEGKTLAVFECVDGTTWAAIFTANT